MVFNDGLSKSAMAAMADGITSTEDLQSNLCHICLKYR